MKKTTTIIGIIMLLTLATAQTVTWERIEGNIQPAEWSGKLGEKPTAKTAPTTTTTTTTPTKGAGGDAFLARIHMIHIKKQWQKIPQYYKTTKLTETYNNLEKTVRVRPFGAYAKFRWQTFKLQPKTTQHNSIYCRYVKECKRTLDMKKQKNKQK